MSKNSTSLVHKLISGSAWSFIGVLMAAAFFYWQEYRNPFNLEISLIDEFNLIEVKGKIQDLRVLYENDDILESKKEIKVVRLNVENKGDTILQNYYDQLEPFGLRFYNAKVLDAEVSYSNSKDLKSKLLEKQLPIGISKSGDVIFSKVIFDSGDLATIKVTLLQDSDQALEISPLGKLANIPELKIIRFESIETSKSWHPLIWFMLGYFGLIITIFIIAGITEIFEKRVKSKKIEKFIAKHENISDVQLKIINYYRSINYSEERLISKMLDGDWAISINKIQSKIETPNSFLTSFFINKRSFQILNKNIFSVESDIIYFNVENESVIVDFFTFVLKS
jgi:hypothetical protein